MTRRKWVLLAVVGLLISACGSAAPAPPPPTLDLPPGKSWELMYLFRDESVEATQAYQLASLFTNVDVHEQQRTLQRFPIDAIIVPWDVRPPGAVSPDGKSLAMIQWDEKVGKALLVDVQTGEARTLRGIDVKTLYTPTVLGWTPDGKALIIYAENETHGSVSTYSLADSKLTPRLALDDVVPQLGQILLSPDSTRLLYCNKVGNRGCAGYALLDFKGGRKSITPPADTSCSGYPAFKWSPDSSQVVLGCLIKRKPILLVIDAAQGTYKTLEMPAEVNDFDWSADGKQLMIDLCAGDYVNVSDPECGPLQLLDMATGQLSAGPSIERTEARRMYWLDHTIVFNESTGGGQEATMYFYDIPSRQTKQFTRNASTYTDASFTVMGLRPIG